MKIVFGVLCECAELIVSVVLWLYLLISTYFVRTFGMRLLASEVIEQSFCDERSGVLRLGAAIVSCAIQRISGKTKGVALENRLEIASHSE